MDLHPSVFEDQHQPEKVKEWIVEMEEIFEVLFYWEE